jgi:hypothetical protein
MEYGTSHYKSITAIPTRGTAHGTRYPVAEVRTLSSACLPAPSGMPSCAWTRTNWQACWVQGATEMIIYIYTHNMYICIVHSYIYIYWKCKIYICRIISGGARRIYIIHITGWKGPHGGWFRELIHYFPERLLPQGLILRSEGAVDGLCMIMYVRSYLRPRRM